MQVLSKLVGPPAPVSVPRLPSATPPVAHLTPTPILLLLVLFGDAKIELPESSPS
jgi:hypothetical protein